MKINFVFKVIHFRYVYVRSSVRQAVHLQVDIGANALEIRVVQSPE
jgi:hypothetical protein